MRLREFLDRARADCERDIIRLDRQLKIDIDYVASTDADSNDVEYYKCQVELQRLERRYLTKQLEILTRWSSTPPQT